MTATQLDEEQLFKLALPITNPGDRARFVHQACEADEVLERRVLALLEAADKSSQFLESPVLKPDLVERPVERPVDESRRNSSPTVKAESSRVEKPGTRIGPYKLIEQIGEGGFGVVYVAEQLEPLRRLVALKLLKPGMDSRQVVARFEAERQALALMDHPHIARVLDGGTTETGLPYFVMELVRGVPITQFCDERRLTPRQRLQLFVPVCQAIQHAHQKGVIHRDIKPSNVLVAMYDERPVPKVIDFGIAKATGLTLTEKTLVTNFGALVGTVEYMSPEQASLNQLDIDTRSDIYSLGVLLYELLTGSTPLDRQQVRQGALLEVLRLVREVETPAPSIRISSAESLPGIAANRGMEPARLSSTLRGELDWVLLKALEKDRSRRYETANALARDIERYLADEWIEARPPSFLYRLGKITRQYRRFLITSLVVFFALAIGTIASLWQAVRATRAESQAVLSAKNSESMYAVALQQQEVAEKERKTAEEQRNLASQERDEAERLRALAQEEKEKAQHHAVTGQLLLGKLSLTQGELPEALTRFSQAYLLAPPQDPRRTSARNLLGAWAGGLQQTLVHDRGVHTLAVSGNGKRLMAGYFHSRVQTWDLVRGLPMGQPLPHAGDVVSAQMDREGRYALIGDWEGARVWDVESGMLRYPLLEHEVREDTVVGPLWSPDERTIVTRSPLTAIRLWDAETGQARGESLPLGKDVDWMRFSSDSKRVAASGEGRLQVWDAATAMPIGDPIDGVTAFAFHPDGKIYAYIHQDNVVVLADAESGKQITTLTHEGRPTAVSFDAKGERLITRDAARVFIWDNYRDDQRTVKTISHGNNLFAAFATAASTGEWITASRGAVRAWRPKGDSPAWERSTFVGIGNRGQMWRSAVLSPDGLSVLTMTENGTAEVIAVASGQTLARETNVRSARFAPDGHAIYFGREDGLLRAYRVDSTDLRRLPRAPLPREMGRVDEVAVSGDGKTVFVGGANQGRIFRAENWAPVGDPIPSWSSGGSVLFSPDGNQLIICARIPTATPQAAGTRKPENNRTVQLTFWNVATGERIGDPIEVAATTSLLAFDREGKNLLVGSSVFSLATRKFHTRNPEAIPKGRRAIMDVLGPVDTTVPTLWDDDKDEPTTIAVPDVAAEQILVSPDGRSVLVIDLEGEARRYDATNAAPLGRAFRPRGKARERSVDGRYTLFGDLSSLVLWDTVLGQPCGESLQREQAHAEATFGREGTLVATHWQFNSHVWDTVTGMMLGPPLRLTSNQISKPIFSADGRQLLIPCIGLEVWQIPDAAPDHAQPLRQWIEALTGLEVNDNATLQKMSARDWLERKRSWNAQNDTKK